MIKDRTCSTSNALLSLGRSLQVSLSLDRYKLTYKLTDTNTPLQSWHTCKFKMETIWGFVDQCCTWGRLFSLFLWDCRCRSVRVAAILVSWCAQNTCGYRWWGPSFDSHQETKVMAHGLISDLHLHSLRMGDTLHGITWSDHLSSL